MLKQLSICAALIAFTAGAANAQQKEATLQRLEVPGAAFDIIIAMPRPQGMTFEPVGVARRTPGAPDRR